MIPITILKPISGGGAEVIGNFVVVASPRVGETIVANNGAYTVHSVEHLATVHVDDPLPKLIVYVKQH